MKKILLLAASLLAWGQLIAQDEPAPKKRLSRNEREKMELFGKVKAEVWGRADAEFARTEAPEKWKGESAVIIAKSVRIEYSQAKRSIITLASNKDAYLYERVTLRKRIKLLDKAAVQEYSEFTFVDDDTRSSLRKTDNIFLGIKVVKPDGKETEVPMDEAVVLEFRSKSMRNQVKKIAVPNLEPGDVIDYFYMATLPVPKSQIDEDGRYFFSPVIHSLTEAYPMLHERLELRIMKNCYLNLRSINGAPELAQKSADDDDVVYSLAIDDRDKTPVKRWFYKYRVLPAVKFQAFFAKGKEHNLIFYAKEKNSVKKTITKEELEKAFTQSWALSIQGGENNAYIGSAVPVPTQLPDWFKTYHLFGNKYNLNKEPKDKLPISLYYAMRSHLTMNGFAFSSASRYFSTYEMYHVMDGYFQPFSYIYESRGAHQLGMLAAYLSYKKIPHDYVISANRSVGSLEDLILPEIETVRAIRVKIGEQYHYIGPMNSSSHFGEIPDDMQGAEAYAINAPLNVNDELKMEKITVPVEAPETNATTTALTASFDPADLTKLKVAKTLTAKGQNRYAEESEALLPYDFINADATKFRAPTLERPTGGGLSAQKNFNDLVINGAYSETQDRRGLVARIKQRKDDDLKNRQENLKKVLEAELSGSKVTVGTFALVQPGLWPEAPELKYSLDFSVEGLSKKAGSNYIVDLGRLVGGQVEIGKDEMDRKGQDVFMPFARSFEYSLTLAIPAGYEVQGLDKFNLNVDNATGSFISTAAAEAGKINITVKKVYKHNFEKAEDWPQMVKFLDAAYQFTQQKILLKKQ